MVKLRPQHEGVAPLHSYRVCLVLIDHFEGTADLMKQVLVVRKQGIGLPKLAASLVTRHVIVTPLPFGLQCC